MDALTVHAKGMENTDITATKSLTGEKRRMKMSVILVNG